MWRQALATDEGVGLPKLRGRWCTTGPGRRRGGDLEELSLCNVGRALEFGNVLDASRRGFTLPHVVWRGRDSACGGEGTTDGDDERLRQG